MRGSPRSWRSGSLPSAAHGTRSSPRSQALCAAWRSLIRWRSSRTALPVFSARSSPPLDVDGALAVGLSAVWVNRSGSSPATARDDLVEISTLLLDPMALHIEQAQQASAAQAKGELASIEQGDARDLPWSDESADVALLLGPLYHLTGSKDRLKALAEARRVLRPGGLLVAAAISRFASTYDGLARGFLAESMFRSIVSRTFETASTGIPTEIRIGSRPRTSIVRTN